MIRKTTEFFYNPMDNGIVIEKKNDNSYQYKHRCSYSNSTLTFLTSYPFQNKKEVLLD